MDVDVIKFNSIYEELIHPPNFISQIEDFEGWLELGSMDDLMWTLEAFKNEDMFEECIIIQKKINEKIQNSRE